jgi:glycosyltransferase involved in cell wall biosynthesis
LRIAFLLEHADLSGGVRTVAAYARLLKQRGHLVTVVSTPSAPAPLRTRLARLIRDQEWPHVPHYGPSHLDSVDVEHRRLESYRPITNRDLPDADVVIATWWLTAEWVAALSPSKGAKVHFVQGHEVEIAGQPAARVAATWKLPLHRIVCSRWLCELASRRYGDTEASYVPCGVDSTQFSAAPRGKQARPTVGIVYAHDRIKGVDLALAAFELASRRMPDLRLCVFGNTPVSKDLPLPAGATFLLMPEQYLIPTIYARCDAWLWPSRREGFGLPILEAMACRTPVVATPAGAAPELLANGGGVLVPPEDPVSLSAAIERVCSLPEPEWMEMSNRARQVAVTHSWDESVRGFEAALELAIARAPQLLRRTNQGVHRSV